MAMVCMQANYSRRGQDEDEDGEETNSWKVGNWNAREPLLYLSYDMMEIRTRKNTWTMQDGIEEDVH